MIRNNYTHQSQLLLELTGHGPIKVSDLEEYCRRIRVAGGTGDTVVKLAGSVVEGRFLQAVVDHAEC